MKTKNLYLNPYLIYLILIALVFVCGIAFITFEIIDHINGVSECTEYCLEKGYDEGEYISHLGAGEGYCDCDYKSDFEKWRES